MSSSLDESGLDESGRGPRAVILGCAGPALTQEERRFFADADPYGFILFRRNIDNPAQVRTLAAELRAAIGRGDAPILIDQEGGRVARLGPPHWPPLPPARAIGVLAERDSDAGHTAARAVGRIIGAMLYDLTIDVVCAPVVDLLLPETHGVIGDRAYTADPTLAGGLAAACCKGFLEAGITPIIKHIPGHGRATADSHLDLPRITASRATLEAEDFAAFRGVAAGAWAMVAHCVYTAIDSERPASISPVVISTIIRDSIGFGGVLIADDIGMKALRGSLAESAAATLSAGCDLTLHCSGVMAEMEEVVPAVSRLTIGAIEELETHARATALCRVAFDPAAERAMLDQLLAS